MRLLRTAKPLSRQDAPDKERGIALLAVLWIIVTGALLVATFNATARSGAVFMASEIELSKTEALLEAGLEIAVARLIDHDDKKTWRAEDFAQTVKFSGREVGIFVADANGFIDLNKSKPELIENLLMNATRKRAVAAKIFEQYSSKRSLNKKKRKRNIGRSSENRSLEQDSNTNRANTRESSGRTALQNTSPNTGASNQEHKYPFVDVTDLLRLEAMTAEIFKKLQPHLTTTSADGKINVNTATDDVLKFLPKISRNDIELFRNSAKLDEQDADNSQAGDQETDSPALNRARAFLTKKPGPSYYISVYVSDNSGKRVTARQFTVILGVDKKAPYRLISSRHLM